jgi:aldehyde:ferredoxin oxidoreductase
MSGSSEEEKGYWGRILWVDLSIGKTAVEELEGTLYQKFLSGIGLGAKVLWDRMPAGIDPLGPENILGFTTGLLTDTGSLFTGRFTVVGKSPLSGGWGDANCGGYFSPWLKRCGLDAVFFSGAGEQPQYLYLDDQTAELKNASDLWGLDAIETETRLKERHGNRAQVACIGPAGEKLSLISGIVTDSGKKIPPGEKSPLPDHP